VSKDLVTKNANLPAHLQKAAASREAAKEFSGGVQSGFPVISYRGKTWRVKQGGDEQVYTDDDGDAIQSIQVVMIRSNENLSKTYYKGKYKEGDNSKPTCWSATGIKPDPNVPEPVSSSCQGCPMNVWGSRTSDDGKKQKACQDVRRMAVIMDHELEAVVEGEKDIDDAAVLLLRVPGASLNPLKDYVEKKLLPKGGLLPYMLVTRIGFDSDAAYPRFTFKGARFLDEDEFSTVEELRDSDIVKRIINEAAELDDEGSTGAAADGSSTDHAENDEGSEPAPSKSSAEEDHFSEPDDDDDEIAPPPKKKRAAAVEDESFDDDDDEEIAPPKKKKAAKKKAKKSAAPKEDDVESPDDSDDDVDDMLDSILG
jgi:hypothetical protein